MLRGELLENSQCRFEMRTLQASTRKGDKYTIELEPDSLSVGTWNVLKIVGTHNRHARRNQNDTPVTREGSSVCSEGGHQTITLKWQQPLNRFREWQTARQVTGDVE